MLHLAHEGGATDWFVGLGKGTVMRIGIIHLRFVWSIGERAGGTRSKTNDIWFYTETREHSSDVAGD